MGPKQHQTHHLGLFSSSLPPTVVVLIALSIVHHGSHSSFSCGGHLVVVVVLSWLWLLCCDHLLLWAICHCGPSSSWLLQVVVKE